MKSRSWVQGVSIDPIDLMRKLMMGARLVQTGNWLEAHDGNGLCHLFWSHLTRAKHFKWIYASSVNKVALRNKRRRIEDMFLRFLFAPLQSP